jgi:hypothetical protein
MAKESSRWQRCRTGIKQLRKGGHATHFCRLENAAGEGNPDVEGVINGFQCWIELKSNDRPAREGTVIRSRCYRSLPDFFHGSQSHEEHAGLYPTRFHVRGLTGEIARRSLMVLDTRPRRRSAACLLSIEAPRHLAVEPRLWS